MPDIFFDNQPGPEIRAKLNELNATFEYAVDNAVGPPGPPGADSTVPGPKGDKGDKGDTGDTGLTGADSTVPGPKGDKGDKGDTGDTGPAGADSVVPGPKGDQGDPGPKGDQGDPGPKGDTGDTGPAGSGTGDVNSTGAVATDDITAYADGTGNAIKSTGKKVSDLVLTGDTRLVDSRAPTGGAGGVLSGTYPNPGFAVDMATQSELDAAIATRAPASHTHTIANVTGLQDALDAKGTSNLALGSGAGDAMPGNTSIPDAQQQTDWDAPSGIASIANKPAVIAAGANAAAARGAIGAGTSNLADAPSDGKTYGRKDAAWVEAGGGGYEVGDVLQTARALAAPEWLPCDGSDRLAASFPALALLLPAGEILGNGVARTLPSSANWYSVTYGNGVFVAVAYNSNKAATSPDGITWTARTLPSSADWYSVTYGNGVFVAVAYNSSTAATSPDGITWTARTPPSIADWQSVTYGNGVFVAVASGSNKAATSPDGITWTARTLPSSANWYSVTYGNGVFVAVASGSNKAATSPDGITWTARTLPSSADWYSVTYGNGVFVAVASGSTATTSPDGITWTARTLPSSANWYSVTYGNGVFVAVASSSSTATTSPDGITWTARTLPSSANWYSVTYGNGVFVAVASSSSTAVTFAKEADATKTRLPTFEGSPSKYIKATA